MLDDLVFMMLLCIYHLRRISCKHFRVTGLSKRAGFTFFLKDYLFFGICKNSIGTGGMYITDGSPSAPMFSRDARAPGVGLLLEELRLKKFNICPLHVDGVVVSSNGSWLDILGVNSISSSWKFPLTPASKSLLFVNSSLKNFNHYLLSPVKPTSYHPTYGNFFPLSFSCFLRYFAIGTSYYQRSCNNPPHPRFELPLI